MLDKKNRIRLKKEFDHVFQTGQSFYSGILGVKTANNKENNVRLGFLVGLKVSKKAVDRNKIKRQLREISSQELKEIRNGTDIVVIALPPILKTDFEIIKKNLKLAFKKLNLYKTEND